VPHQVQEIKTALLKLLPADSASFSCLLFSKASGEIHY